MALIKISIFDESKNNSIYMEVPDNYTGTKIIANLINKSKISSRDDKGYLAKHKLYLLRTRKNGMPKEITSLTLKEAGVITGDSLFLRSFNFENYKASAYEKLKFRMFNFLSRFQQLIIWIWIDNDIQEIEVPNTFTGEQLINKLLKEMKLQSKNDNGYYPEFYLLQLKNNKIIRANTLREAGVKFGDTLIISSRITSDKSNLIRITIFYARKGSKIDMEVPDNITGTYLIDFLINKRKIDRTDDEGFPIVYKLIKGKQEKGMAKIITTLTLKDAGVISGDHLILNSQIYE